MTDEMLTTRFIIRRATPIVIEIVDRVTGAFFIISRHSSSWGTQLFGEKYITKASTKEAALINAYETVDSISEDRLNVSLQLLNDARKSAMGEAYVPFENTFTRLTFLELYVLQMRECTQIMKTCDDDEYDKLFNAWLDRVCLIAQMLDCPSEDENGYDVIMSDWVEEQTKDMQIYVVV